MIFTIAVHGAPYAGQASHHALSFCQAAISSGHTINRVFFYHEAVSTALNTQVPPQGERDVLSQWHSFGTAHEVELAVCIANGLKRGVLSEPERQRYDKPSATLAEGFELVGLGQLIDAVASSDRYVEFPGMKNLLCVISRPPYESSHSLEAIEAAMVGAAFELSVSVLFRGEGVWCLLNGQDAGPLQQRTLSKVLNALPTYEVSKLYACSAALNEHGLTPEDLCLAVTPVTPSEQSRLYSEQDVVIGAQS